MINEVNAEMFKSKDKNDTNNNNDGPSKDRPNNNETEEDENTPQESDKNAPKKGTLMLDATCTPADIAYPTDVNLLNEAREKLEDMIDTLHPHTGAKLKPRTYRQEARKRYLRFIKQRKPRKAAIRKAIGQQLRYVTRNIGHIDRQLEQTELSHLSRTQQTWLETIRELYTQQRQMYERKTKTIEKRIVSISQPHVRPIVRGKTNASTEFGAKVSISLIDGYAYIDKLNWEAYNEESLLIPAIKEYKNHHGYYPEAVLVDKIYRNQTNRRFCKRYGIRISGPRLGRPPKEMNPAILRQERRDSADRNAVEGKFGEGKTRYGLDRIMARLKGSSETVIAMAFFCMNISRRLRELFYRFLWLPENSVFLSFNFNLWVFG
jgi:hypothetical protein